MSINPLSTSTILSSSPLQSLATYLVPSTFTLPCSPSYSSSSPSYLSIQPRTSSYRSFSVVQYNVLAGNLSTPIHFPYVKPEYLDWKRRRDLIIKQIKSFASVKPNNTIHNSNNSDVGDCSSDLPTFLCFEELTDYWTYFQSELSQLGYSSIYFKRPSIHNSSWSGSDKQDGCLIAYQNNVIKRVVDVDRLNYEDNHDRIGLIALFEWKHSSPDYSPYICIATTHLYWDSNKLSVQLMELDQFMEAITKMQQKHYQQHNNTGELTKDNISKKDEIGGDLFIPTILAGDFNNSPKSQIYQRIIHHHTFTSLQHNQRQRQLQHQNDEEVNNKISHSEPTNLIFPVNEVPGHSEIMYEYASSYGYDGFRSEPLATSVTNRRCWTIDYIFYSAKVHIHNNQNTNSSSPTSSSTSSSSTSSLSSLSLSSPSSSCSSICDIIRLTDVLSLPCEFDLRAESGPVGWNFNEDLMTKGHTQGGIPNSVHPSDHIPIMARFELLPIKEQLINKSKTESDKIFQQILP